MKRRNKDSPLRAGRAEISIIDEALVELLARRADAGRSVARVKREAGLPLVDPAQEARVIRRAAVRARAHGLPEEELRRLFWCVVALTRRVEAVSR